MAKFPFQINLDIRPSIKIPKVQRVHKRLGPRICLESSNFFRICFSTRLVRSNRKGRPFLDVSLKSVNNKDPSLGKTREYLESRKGSGGGGMDRAYNQPLKLMSHSDRRFQYSWLISKSLLHQWLRSRNGEGDLMCKSRDETRNVTLFTSASKEKETP